jgi:hypothetical protein
MEIDLMVPLEHFRDRCAITEAGEEHGGVRFAWEEKGTFRCCDEVWEGPYTVLLHIALI